MLSFCTNIFKKKQILFKVLIKFKSLILIMTENLRENLLIYISIQKIGVSECFFKLKSILKSQ